jgi:hypothetical protein
MTTSQRTGGKPAASGNRRRAARVKSPDFAELAQIIGHKHLTWHEIAAMLLGTKQARRTPLPEYAKVVAVGSAKEVAQVRGCTGIVLDAAKLQGRWTHAVYFPSQQETLVLHEQSLWDSGQNVPQDVLYGGAKTRRVHVDKNGNGALLA